MALAAYLEYFETAQGERMRIALRDESHAQEVRGTLAIMHLATPSGLIIEADRPANIDDHLEVEFSPEARVTARVLWKSGKLLGCEFENVAIEAVKPAPLHDDDFPSQNFRRRRSDTVLSNSAGETLGGRMRSLRSQRGLTQDDVAASLGVSVASVSYWESDRSLPKRGRLVDLAKLFGVPTSDLASFYIEAQTVDETDNLASARSDIATILGVEAAQIKIVVEY